MDRYTILQTLGEGVQGSVQLATDKVSGQSVAIKVSAQAAATYSQQEDKILWGLPAHPNIIVRRDFFYTTSTNNSEFGETCAVLVTDAVMGGDVFEAMAVSENNDIPAADAKRVARQLLCALAHCHQNGVAHRDVKPENVLLDSRDMSTANAVLCDFGLATTDAISTVACGSEPYAAPEITSMPSYDPKSVDVWAAGVFLFNILTSFMPWTHATLHDPVFERYATIRSEFWLWAQLHTAPGIVTPEFESLFNGMCHPDPALRFTAQKCLEHPFFTQAVPAAAP